MRIQKKRKKEEEEEEEVVKSYYDGTDSEDSLHAYRVTLEV